MKNSFSQPNTPVIGNVTGSTMAQANGPQGEEPAAAPYVVDTVQLFEKGYNLSISLGDSCLWTNCFYLESHDGEGFQTLVIKVISHPEGTKRTKIDDKKSVSTVVFVARRLTGQKPKVTCLRPGKWAEFLMETYYPQQMTLNSAPIDDAEVDYAYLSSNEPEVEDVLSAELKSVVKTTLKEKPAK